MSSFIANEWPMASVNNWASKLDNIPSSTGQSSEGWNWYVCMFIALLHLIWKQLLSLIKELRNSCQLLAQDWGYPVVCFTLDELLICYHGNHTLLKIDITIVPWKNWSAVHLRFHLNKTTDLFFPLSLPFCLPSLLFILLIVLSSPILSSPSPLLPLMSFPSHPLSHPFLLSFLLSKELPPVIALEDSHLCNYSIRERYIIHIPRFAVWIIDELVILGRISWDIDICSSPQVSQNYCLNNHHVCWQCGVCLNWYWNLQQ